ncbi:Tn3 transposase DDE domain protein [compost metagenome]
MHDLADSKIYVIGKSSDSPKLEKLLHGQNNTKIIQENYDDVLRLAHSIREGTVSASLIMGKIRHECEMILEKRSVRLCTGILTYKI